MTRVTAIAATTTLALLLWTSGGWAQGADAILGTWEEYNTERDEYVRVDFGEDGMVTLEVFDYHTGFYLLDEQQHMIAVYETEEERENLGASDWVAYKLKGNKLTIMASPEEKMVFLRVDRPEKTVSAVVGSWQFDPAKTDFDWGDDAPPQMLLVFGNDGSASYMELDEELAGSYMVDAEMGTIELTIEDDVETGTYRIEGDELTLTVDEDTHVFARVA
jgi:hypothetical protein